MNLIVVDVQPAHKESYHVLSNVMKLVSSAKTVTWLFNSKELGYDDDEGSIAEWLEEKGYDTNSITFIPKEYGFLREAMSQIGEDELIELGKKTVDAGVADSRDVPGFEDYEPTLGIPYELARRISSIKNPVLVGGGRYECLDEIRLLLLIFGSSPKIGPTNSLYE